MDKKVYVSDSYKATFTCPHCSKTKVADVSKFANANTFVRVKSTCACGHQWTSVLEKRKQYRKTVNFPGTYNYIKGDKVLDRGGMKVVDLSSGGLKVKLNVERNLQVGDHLDLEFHLDDRNGTLIKKRVKIRSVSGAYLGTTFRSMDGAGQELGFYLMG
jgi:hypothetical protein